jgi:hypothetical protein
MPLNGRDFNDLAFSVAGVMPQEEGGKGTSYTANGVRSDQSNVIVEGLNNTNPRDAGAEATPPLDSLQEFKMQTSNYSAEYGRVAGGVVNMVMKRGGNQLHGGIFEFLRNDKFDSRSFFDSTTQKSELRRNQFGATVGGPVVIPHIYNGHDHTFFFASWESFRELAGSNQIGTVPSLAERGLSSDGITPLGYFDFSKSFTTKGGTLLTPQNPLTGYPDNHIPLANINPVSSALLNFFPFPSTDITPAATGANNYRGYAVSPSQWDNLVIKIDQQLSAKDEFSVRALEKQQTSSDPFSGSGIPIFGSTTKRKELMVGITETRIFTPTLINEFRLGLTRMKSDETSSDGGTNWARMMGMCKSSDPQRCPIDDPRYAQFPKISLGGSSSTYMGLGDSTTNPVRYTTNNYNLNDILTWNKGKHTVKFGADILRVQYFQATNSNFSGSLSFGGNKTGNAVADFLLGEPSSVGLTLGNPYNHIFNNNYAAFLQDDFKALPSLTLNLGLRYELETMPHESNGQWSSYDPALHKIVTAATLTPAQQAQLGTYADPSLYTSANAAGLPQTLVTPNYKRLAPRVGFAWRPFDDNRTVIRGGYGVFYTGSRLSALRTELAGKFPFSLPMSFSSGNLPSLSDPWDFAPSVKLTTTTGIDLNPKSAYVQSWNFTLENEIGKGVTLEVGYTGSKGTHLGRQIDTNQWAPGLYVPGVCDPVNNFNNCTIVPVSAFGTVPVVAFRPVDSHYGSINYFTFNSNSTYNAGTITVRKKFDHGLFFRANYTYGKSIDVASGFNFSGNGGYKGAQNSQDPNAERGRSDFDRRHVFSANFVYKLPINKTVVLRGWQLAGSSTIYSGAPFTPQLGVPSQDGGGATRPNRLSPGDVNPANGNVCSDPSQFQATTAAYFDVNCFYTPTWNGLPNILGIFGNSGRNILDGPSNFVVNLALSRTFRIGENGKLQFRWEAFNVTNHTNLNLPNDNVDEPGAATITKAKANRIMQVGIKYNF